MIIKDKLGREIKVGDYICYAVEIYKSPSLQIAKVIDISQSMDNYNIPHYKIKIQGVHGNVPNFIKLRPSTLQFPIRTVVVDNVPQEVLDILNDV